MSEMLTKAIDEGYEERFDWKFLDEPDEMKLHSIDDLIGSIGRNHSALSRDLSAVPNSADVTEVDTDLLKIKLNLLNSIEGK